MPATKIVQMTKVKTKVGDKVGSTLFKAQPRQSNIFDLWEYIQEFK